MAHAIAFVLLCGVLTVAAVTDLRTGKVHNRLVFPAMIAGLVLWTVAGFLHNQLQGATNGLAGSAVALAAGLVPFAILFLVGGLGGGDAKLMGAVGAITGDWHCAVTAGIYAVAIAFVMAIIIMIHRRVIGQTMRRLLSALMFAAARVKPQMPTDSPRVPFAVAIALGGVLAGIECLLHVNMPWSLAR